MQNPTQPITTRSSSPAKQTEATNAQMELMLKQFSEMQKQLSALSVQNQTLLQQNQVLEEKLASKTASRLSKASKSSKLSGVTSPFPEFEEVKNFDQNLGQSTIVPEQEEKHTVEQKDGGQESAIPSENEKDREAKVSEVGTQSDQDDKLIKAQSSFENVDSNPKTKEQDHKDSEELSDTASFFKKLDSADYSRKSEPTKSTPNNETKSPKP